MSDMERDQIDQDMVESMKNCQTKIESLKADSKKAVSYAKLLKIWVLNELY